MMKKYIFPSIVAIYFIILFKMTDIMPEKYSLDFVLKGIGDVPSEIINGFLIILALGIVSAIIYILPTHKGGNKE